MDRQIDTQMDRQTPRWIVGWIDGSRKTKVFLDVWLGRQDIQTHKQNSSIDKNTHKNKTCTEIHMSIRGCTDDHHHWKNGVPKGGPMSYIHAAIQIRPSSLINARHMHMYTRTHTHTNGSTNMVVFQHLCRAKTHRYICIYIIYIELLYNLNYVYRN